MRSPIVVFIYAHGSSYAAYLATALQSLRETGLSNVAHVSYHDIPRLEVLLLKEGFPEVTFAEMQPDEQRSDGDDVASRKVSTWVRFIEGLNEETVALCLDADVLVRGDLREDLSQPFDFLVTVKDADWFLNTGVLAIRVNSVTRGLLRVWRSRTQEILGSPAETKLAKSAAGAADQFALAKLLELDRKDGKVSDRLVERPLQIEVSRNVTLYIADCRRLNHVEVDPPDENNLILHYKGWMRKVIDGDGRFNRFRTAEKSFEMWAIWEETYKRATENCIVALTRHSLSDHVEGCGKEVLNISYRPLAILPSEATLLGAVAKQLGVTKILESGTGHGFSTEALVNMMPRTQMVSCDPNLQPTVSRPSTEQALRDGRLRFIKGSSERVLPKCIRDSSSGDRILLVIDGPKGSDAVLLARHLMMLSDNVVAIAIHDMHRKSFGRPNRGRLELSHSFDRVLFSDDQELVDALAPLDQLTDHEPHIRSGFDSGSYGPTLAIIFPTYRDRIRAKRQLFLPYYVESRTKRELARIRNLVESRRS